MYVGATCSNLVVAILYFHLIPCLQWILLHMSVARGSTVHFKYCVCACIHFTSDPTLTLENVLAVMQKVQFWGATESYNYLDTPPDLHQLLIRHHRDGKSALIKEYLSHHPYPRWGQIVELLEERESVGKARAGLAQEVKDKYMTSECAIFAVRQHQRFPYYTVVMQPCMCAISV